MSSRERNALLGLIGGEPAENALRHGVMAADVVRAPAAALAAEPPLSAGRVPHTIRAAPEQGWFRDLTANAAQWMRRNKVPSVMDYPPIRLLLAAAGSGHPGEIAGGPGQAISAFARRAPHIMRRFSDPGFHNFILRHGPPKGHFSQLRDWAPESVIEDLWQRYSATPEAQRAARRFAERQAREQGKTMGRRSSDR